MADTLTARILLSVLGAAAMITGGFLDWISGAASSGTTLDVNVFWSTDFLTGQASFLGSGGALVMLLGLLALLGLAAGTGWLTRLAGALGVIAFVLYTISLFRVGAGLGRMGIGMWLVLVGGILALIGGFIHESKLDLRKRLILAGVAVVTLTLGLYFLYPFERCAVEINGAVQTTCSNRVGLRLSSRGESMSPLVSIGPSLLLALGVTFLARPILLRRRR